MTRYISIGNEDVDYSHLSTPKVEYAPGGYVFSGGPCSQRAWYVPSSQFMQSYTLFSSDIDLPTAAKVMTEGEKWWKKGKATFVQEMHAFMQSYFGLCVTAVRKSRPHPQYKLNICNVNEMNMYMFVFDQTTVIFNWRKGYEAIQVLRTKVPPPIQMHLLTPFDARSDFEKAFKTALDMHQGLLTNEVTFTSFLTKISETTYNLLAQSNKYQPMYSFFCHYGFFIDPTGRDLDLVYNRFVIKSGFFEVYVMGAMRCVHYFLYIRWDSVAE